MNYLKNYIDICNDFNEGKFGVKEFQSRLETAIIPDEISLYMIKSLHNACSDLEEILQYCHFDNFPNFISL